MKMYFYKTNGYNGVVLVNDDKVFDCQIESDGKFNGSVDIYNDTNVVINDLKDHIAKSDFNSFETLANDFPNNVYSWDEFQEGEIELNYIGLVE